MLDGVKRMKSWQIYYIQPNCNSLVLLFIKNGYTNYIIKSEDSNYLR